MRPVGCQAGSCCLPVVNQKISCVNFCIMNSCIMRLERSPIIGVYFLNFEVCWVPDRKLLLPTNVISFHLFKEKSLVKKSVVPLINEPLWYLLHFTLCTGAYVVTFCYACDIVFWVGLLHTPSLYGCCSFGFFLLGQLHLYQIISGPFSPSKNPP